MVFIADDAELIGLGLDYAGYVKQLNPALWFRLNELSGAAAINSGSLGAAFNGVYTACTLAQAGKMSPTGAVLFDGATSLITVPAGAYANYTEWSIAHLVKLSGAGESNFSQYWSIGATFAELESVALGGFQLIRATNGNSQTSAGITANTWTWIFSTLSMAGDKKLRVSKGVAGAVTEYGYSTQVAVSALTDLSATALVLGNRAAADRTQAGWHDEWILFNSVLTPAQMLQIVRLTNV